MQTVYGPVCIVLHHRAAKSSNVNDAWSMGARAHIDAKQCIASRASAAHNSASPVPIAFQVDFEICNLQSAIRRIPCYSQHIRQN
jgi:hypothetical protein